MNLRLALASVLVVPLAGSVAFAQAPGEADLAPPGMAPAVVVASPPPPIRRLSVGLGIGGMDLAPHSAPDATTSYSMGQIAVRYLATRHLEIELALGGGQEQLEDGSPGYRELSQGVLALRWRFSPQRRWNWWLMAGMGSLAITGPEASDTEREAQTQSTLQFGVGLERRWNRFAIQAEMRVVGVAPNDTEDMPALAYPPNMGTVGTSPANDPYQGKKGGSFSISGNYYF
jgi:hypothetical protein